MHQTGGSGEGKGAVMTVYGGYNASRGGMYSRYTRSWLANSPFSIPVEDHRLIVPLHLTSDWGNVCHFRRETLSTTESDDLQMIRANFIDLARDGIFVKVFLLELLMADTMTGYTPVFLEALIHMLHELKCCVVFDEVGRIYVEVLRFI